jgi:hypothetical protein
MTDCADFDCRRLKSELSRWSDDKPVTFHSPLKVPLPAQRQLVLEINEFPETSAVALPGHQAAQWRPGEH